MKHGLKRRQIGLVVLMLGLIAAPALAQQAHFGSVTLSPGFDAAQGQLQGRTGGQNSLPAVITNRDRDGNLCLGYGSSTPDYTVTLQGTFAQLSFQVESGRDTTLIIQGPNDRTVRCGDDSGSNLDAVIQGSDWAGGTYKVWVGTVNPGERFSYTLTIRE